MQRLGVMVHNGSAQEDLKISKHVRNQEPEQDQASHGHDGLLPDRGFVESRYSHQLRMSDYGTQG